MDTDAPKELLLELDGDTLRLLAPAVGLFTGALAPGRVVTPGAEVGTLSVLGREFTLRAPRGAAGVVRNERPERVRAPVGYGSLLYELVPIADAGADSDAGAPAETDAAKDAAGLSVRSPQTGRFYHRSAPGEPAFVGAGEIITEGRPIGLIEVMKTFTHVTYRGGATGGDAAGGDAAGGLPARAKVVRYIAGDGAEVTEGDAVLELEAP